MASEIEQVVVDLELGSHANILLRWTDEQFRGRTEEELERFTVCLRMKVVRIETVHFTFTKERLGL